LLYAPLPLLLWAAIRFGAVGASSAILIVTVVLVSHSLEGPSPFVGVSPERNVLSLQLFLTALSVPVLLLGALIDQLRLARENLRQLAHSVLRDRDEERRRVARQLHESTGQNLVGAMMAVGQLERDVPQAAKAVQQIEGLLQQSISDLRSVSYVLHPPLLDEQGLSFALRNYISGYRDRHGTEVDLRVPEELPRLPAEVEIALFRVVQEGLALVSHRSAGRVARVHLRRESMKNGDALVLTIDDGEEERSALPALVSAIGRRLTARETLDMWAAGMRERIQRLGGHIEIAIGAETTFVSAVIPVP
jgi:signal transduction histidine kinase